MVPEMMVEASTYRVFGWKKLLLKWNANTTKGG
jgi:hypothetical protein